MKYLAAGLLTLLSTIDIVSTRYILNDWGTELNPLLAPHIDTWELFAIKTIGVAIAAYLFASHFKTRWVVNALYATVALYGVVVAWNVGQIIHLEVTT